MTPSAPSRLRLVPAIDRWPRVLAWAQGVPGKLVLLAVFAAGLWLHGRTWWLDATLLLAALTAWPAQRRLVLLAGTWAWLSRHTWFNWNAIRGLADREGVRDRIEWELFEPTVVVCTLVFCAVFHWAVRRFRGGRLLGRPVLALLTTYLALICVASYAPLGGLARTYLWAFLVVLGRYLWVLAYSLADQRGPGGREIVLDLGHYLPFWIGASATPTPFPKGSAYLRKIEAKDARELAVSQLKAVKLLFWAGVLLALKELLQAVAYGYEGHLPPQWAQSVALGIPTLEEAFALSLADTPYVWYLGWLALVTNFFVHLLELAIWGHVIVATCRMAGWNALRNTYRPLSAGTIAEFWNRYYYYFKELLVEFFFYPTYLRAFRRHPRLRLFFATMVAAGFGNLLYHFLRDVGTIVQLGPLEALRVFHVYVFYCLLLGTAIGLSQLRGRQKRVQPPTLRRRFLAPLSVLTFYCVLSVFDEPDRSRTLGDHFAFLLTLFGVA